MGAYEDIAAVRISHLIEIMRSPLHYQHCVKNGKESPALSFGRFYHALILEPETLRQNYYRLDPAERPDQAHGMTAKANKLFVQGLAESNPGKAAISNEDRDLAYKMRAVIVGSPYPAALVARKGKFEEEKVWAIEGVKAKGKIDKRIDGENIGLDLKTCRDATLKAFTSEAMKHHYHTKAAWYIDGFGLSGFLWIAQEKAAPYAVNVIRPTLELLEQGRTNYKFCLKVLKQCREKYGHETGKNQWPGYEFMEGGWPEMELPKWANSFSR